MTFLILIASIFWIDVLLSGDNALVIASVSHGLPETQRRRAILLGTLFAIVLRVILLFLASTLLSVPGLSLVAGLYITYVAFNLLAEPAPPGGAAPRFGLLSAVAGIALADVSMSLDNVVAIAAVAGNAWLPMVLGILLSIPLLVAASLLISSVLESLPILRWAGAMFLGWIAGGLVAHDSLVAPFFTAPHAEVLTRSACVCVPVASHLLGGYLKRSYPS